MPNKIHARHAYESISLESWFDKLDAGEIDFEEYARHKAAFLDALIKGAEKNSYTKLLSLKNLSAGGIRFTLRFCSVRTIVNVRQTQASDACLRAASSRSRSFKKPKTKFSAKSLSLTTSVKPMGQAHQGKASGEATSFVQSVPALLDVCHVISKCATRIRHQIELPI
eukprot:4775313-Pyramimonas_sp.AAC.2